MAVHAIYQTAQTPQSTPAQDQSSGGVAGEFADLLKHVYGQAITGSSLLDSQAMIDMTGSVPAYTPPAPPPAVPQTTTSTTASTSSNTQSTASNSGSASAPAAPTTVAATDANGGNNGGSSGQQEASQQNQRQNAQQSNSNASPAPTATTQTAAPPKAANANGDDATTEETAAVMAAAAYVVQPTQPQTPAVEAVAQSASAGTAATGRTADATRGDAAQTGAQAQAAADESTPDETPIWSANFLSSAATTPQMAQQAASLSQITGSSGGSVSTQSTTGTGTGVAAPSASALVPDAVLAVPGFFSNGQNDGSAGNGGSGQDTGQQQDTDSNAVDSGLDPAFLGLTQDAQAMMALATLTQSASQGLVAGQTQNLVTGVAASAAAAPSAASAEAALPQPTTQVPSTSANTSSFASQVQDTEENQAPQTARQIVLPSAADQIKMQIEKGLQAGSTTIKVQLTPDSLGRVDVKLDIQNGSVKATITADRPETVALLKSDQAGMVQALQDAGLNADSSSLSFYLRGDQQRQFAQGGRQGRNQSNNANAGDDPLLAGVTATSAASSATGAGNLDISV